MKLRSLNPIFSAMSLITLVLSAQAATADNFEPPINTYLADSPWPMSHRNPYNQASSPLAGPQAEDPIAHELVLTLPTAITLNYSNT